MDPETQKRFERYKKWGTDYLERQGVDPQEFDFEAYFDSTLTDAENQHEFAKQNHVVKHQYGSRNYATDMERRQEEAMEAERFRKAQETSHEAKYEALPGRKKEFEGNVRHERPRDVTEEVEHAAAPEPESEIKKSLLSGVSERVSGFVEERKKQFGMDEASQERNLKEREFKARQSIEARAERLHVNALERKEKEYARREFAESPVGRVLAGIKERHAEQGGYGYRASPSGQVEPASPMRSALHSRDTPMWLRGSGNETPGWMGGGAMRGAPAQRSAIMDVAMGRTSGYQGYRGGYQEGRQPRRKVIVVNGRTYVVQHEPTSMRGGSGYGAPPPEPPTMLQMAMVGPAAAPGYVPRREREQPHVSPLMQASLGGGSPAPSPMMQAMMSGHHLAGSPHSPAHHSNERPSPLQKAMGGHGKGFKFG